MCDGEMLEHSSQGDSNTSEILWALDQDKYNIEQNTPPNYAVMFLRSLSKQCGAFDMCSHSGDIIKQPRPHPAPNLLEQQSYSWRNFDSHATDFNESYFARVLIFDVQRFTGYIFIVHVTKESVRLNAYLTRVEGNDSRLRLRVQIEDMLRGCSLPDHQNLLSCCGFLRATVRSATANNF